MNITEATYTAESGQVLEIVHGNITHESTDAVVNAANSYLVHGGGVAGAIARAGGAAIQDQSDAWVETHGELAMDVAVTSGEAPEQVRDPRRGADLARRGRRRRRAAGPRGAQHPRQGRRAQDRLDRDARHLVRHRLPQGTLRQILLEETFAFFARSPESSVRLVRMTNFDTPTVTDFLEALDGLKKE